MKLLNYTLLYLSGALLIVIGAWAVIFYINMLDEIYDSIDDGLANSKILIIGKVQEDSTLIHKTEFRESNYAFQEIAASHALSFRDVYSDSTFYMQHEGDYEPVRILKTVFRATNGRYYQLQIASSMVEEDDLIEDLFYAILWLYVILLTSVLLINNVLLRRIWKPFYEILNNLKNFRLGSHEEFSTSKTRVREFNILNETASSLLQRSILTFNSQKQFIENASHELQTPLAISLNKLELLSEKSSMTEEHLEELSAVIQSLQNLTRLNRTLLLLSKIDNRQFPEEKPVNFNELTRRLISSFADLSEFKEVAVSVSEEANAFHTMNPDLAEIMLSNLLKNAIVHNFAGGTLTVTLGSDHISIENTGTSEMLDGAHIFDRFYKKSPVKNSTGLGLAIVKSIAGYYNLEVTYDYNGNHIFRIDFPANHTTHSGDHKSQR